MKALDELGEADETLVVFISDNGGVDWRMGFKDLPLPHPERPQFAIEVREYDNVPLQAGRGSVYEGGVRVTTHIGLK
jgi:arylsulfatase A-like enzyme